MSLATYLNDHYAGSVGAIDLVKDGARRHSGTEVGTFLAGLAREIEQDRESLRRVMAAAGARPHRAKHLTAWFAEKGMRIKMRRAPQPLMLLETLELGITGKLLGWRALEAAGVAVPVALDDLIARAEAQIAAVERHRLAAAGVLAS